MGIHLDKPWARARRADYWNVAVTTNFVFVWEVNVNVGDELGGRVVGVPFGGVLVTLHPPNVDVPIADALSTTGNPGS